MCWLYVKLLRLYPDDIRWAYGNQMAASFQGEFNVYGRTGEPCPRCGTKIEMRRLGGRSSHFCRICQLRSASRRGY